MWAFRQIGGLRRNASSFQSQQGGVSISVSPEISKNVSSDELGGAKGKRKETQSAETPQNSLQAI